MTCGSVVALGLTGVLLSGCAARAPAAPDLDPLSTRPEARPSPAKSHVAPALEIVAMNALINFAGRHVTDPAAFEVTLASIRRNLQSAWVVEDDPFEVNQFLHPYQGAMYHDLARSTGHGYWAAAVYTFAGSALWEIAGETTPPSKNDQIASGIAGSFLGEPLFRTARMLLDRSRGRPGVWRTLGATVISPAVGFNQMLFGERFDPPERDPIAASDIRIVVGVAATLDGSVRALSPRDFDGEFIGFSVDHGFPGKAGYTHERPFDYFRVEGVASTGGLSSLASRGLLAGKDYERGPVRGVWGAYGSYDYFAPDVFRISSTAISLGSTMQASVSPGLTMHGSGLIGVGYTAAQAIDGLDESDYHYGVAPQALASVRLIAGKRASFDLTAREYLISDVAGFGTRQRDLVFRGDASLTLRLFGPHAVAMTYVLSQREATDASLPRLTQRRETLGVFYSFLGSRGFGAVR
jgi:hypothetical protein